LNRPIALDLSSYRSAILLDEPFNRPEHLPEEENDRMVLVDELLAIMKCDAGNQSYSGKRRLLKTILTVRPPQPFPDRFQEFLDQLLTWETIQRKPIPSSRLPRISGGNTDGSFRAASRCALWQGDITNLHIDAIVNAANSALLGCFQPFHGCVDNAIHSNAGPRVREDCHTIMRLQGGEEETGRVKITRAYNLPSRFILHTVGPFVTGGSASREQEDQLAACYRSCLDLVCRLPEIRSIAFCCISTGVFGFPAGAAARVALQTVEAWLDDHSGALDLVVFDLFRKEDLIAYESHIISIRRIS
jgi:O-acetyl-ADP-ribose deacetylase (regulator of RNase III)